MQPVDELTELLYEALQHTARGILGRGRAGEPVDPTDLVHEAYVRLAGAYPSRTLTRPQFLALAATLIRRYLIDDFRRRASERRGGTWRRVTSSEMSGLVEEESLDLSDLDEALTRLAEVDARQARIVELRFFGGMTTLEVAEVLNVSRRTIAKEWVPLPPG